MGEGALEFRFVHYWLPNLVVIGCHTVSPDEYQELVRQNQFGQRRRLGYDHDTSTLLIYTYHDDIADAVRTIKSLVDTSRVALGHAAPVQHHH
jgi:hypothetical protein